MKDDVLIGFARAVLMRLEQDADWDADTMEYIDSMATSMGLANTENTEPNPSGQFRVNPEAMEAASV